MILASVAFANGYAIHDEAPLSPRARHYHRISTEVVHSFDDPFVLRLIEAAGATEGLYAKIYKRRDRLWMKYDSKVRRWAKSLSMNVPPELLAPEVAKAYSEAPADTEKQRHAVKAVILDYLQAMLAQHPSLDAEIRSLSAAAMAEGKAEGQTAAEALLAHAAKERVPDLTRSAAANLKTIQASRDYGQGSADMVKGVVAGLAGDAAIKYVALSNDDSSNNEAPANSLIPTFGLGAGAAFYTDLNIHGSFALAMLAAYAANQPDAQVNFVTVGDDRVCPECLAAEDGNPYSAGSVPPIPLHSGCRCWYTPADE